MTNIRHWRHSKTSNLTGCMLALRDGEHDEPLPWAATHTFMEGINVRLHLAENLAIVLESFHSNTWDNQSLFLPLQWEMPSYEGHSWPGYPGMMVSVRVKAAQRQKHHGDRRQGYGSPQYSQVIRGIRSMGCSWLNPATSAPHRPLVSPQGRSLGPCLPVGETKSDQTLVSDATQVYCFNAMGHTSSWD